MDNCTSFDVELESNDNPTMTTFADGGDVEFETHGDSEILSIQADRFSHDDSGFKSFGDPGLCVNLDIYNGLGKTIIVKGRLGYTAAIPPNQIPDGTLKIKRTTVFGMNTLMDPCQRFRKKYADSEVGHPKHLIYKDIQQHAENTVSKAFRSHTNTTRYVYRYDAKQFKVVGQSIYLADTDLAVMLAPSDMSELCMYQLVHPSEQNKDYEPFVRKPNNHQDIERCDVSLVINDSNGYLGDRYTHMVGQASKIPRTRDNNIRDGLYIYRVMAYNKNKRDMAVDTDVIPLNEIDDLPYIFKTEEDAKSLGSIVDRIKEQNAINKERNALEKERTAFENAKKKEEMDINSHQRKDSLEKTKTVAAWAGILIGLGTLLKKLWDLFSSRN